MTKDTSSPVIPAKAGIHPPAEGEAGDATAAGAGEDPAGWVTERYLRLPDGSFPHLGVRSGDVTRVALLSGNPERVELMAERLDGAQRVGDRRGYGVFTGLFDGARLTVATSGVGSPSMAIAAEELAACGTSCLIRVGSCAALSLRLPVGGVAVATGAISDEGTSRAYAPANFPPVASHRVVAALIKAAERCGTPVEVGLSRSTDSFYTGERDAEIIARWKRLGVLAFEMETSCLFTVAATLGCEAGSVLCAGTNLLTGEATYQGQMLDEYAAGQNRMLELAMTAAADLSRLVSS